MSAVSEGGAADENLEEARKATRRSRRHFEAPVTVREGAALFGSDRRSREVVAGSVLLAAEGVGVGGRRRRNVGGDELIVDDDEQCGVGIFKIFFLFSKM